MPFAPKRPCTSPGCPAYAVREGKCGAHQRASPAARGYDAEWHRLRARHLAQHPNCKACGTLGSHVDHVQPHRGDDRLRLDPANLQTLCARCHSRKTALFDGGFGRG